MLPHNTCNYEMQRMLDDPNESAESVTEACNDDVDDTIQSQMIVILYAVFAFQIR